MKGERITPKQPVERERVTSEIVSYPRTETEAERKAREAKKLPQPTYSYTVTGVRR